MKWKQAVPRVPPLVCNQWEQGSGDVAVSANFREHDRTWKMTAVSTWRRATSAMNLDSGYQRNEFGFGVYREFAVYQTITYERV